MERKNYLVEELSNEEKAYLKSIIQNTKIKYIRDNYDYLNSSIMCVDERIESESIIDSIFSKFETELKSAVEFECLIENSQLYKSIKALSLKEKMVLFSLYKENKNINETANEMKIDRATARRLRNKALSKIMRDFFGGNNNV